MLHPARSRQPWATTLTSWTSWRQVKTMLSFANLVADLERALTAAAQGW